MSPGVPVILRQRYHMKYECQTSSTYIHYVPTYVLRLVGYGVYGVQHTRTVRSLFGLFAIKCRAFCMQIKIGLI